jgi:hypothetical protein
LYVRVAGHTALSEIGLSISENCHASLQRARQKATVKLPLFLTIIPRKCIEGAEVKLHACESSLLHEMSNGKFPVPKALPSGEESTVQICQKTGLAPEPVSLWWQGYKYLPVTRKEKEH